jgi:hypothetical protein
MAQELLDYYYPSRVSALGENWYRQFINRYSKLIKPVKQRRIKVDRIKERNSTAVNTFFDRLDPILREYKVAPLNLYNIDESGVQDYKSRGEKVVTSVSNKGGTAIKSTLRKTKAYIAIKYISVAGTKISPLVIYPGKNVWSTYLKRGFDTEEHKEWKFTVTENS